MKNFFSFLLTLIIAVVLTFEINGTGGILVVTLLACAMIISEIILFVSAKTTTFGLALSDDIVNKGDSFKAHLFADKKFLLPSCFVEVELGFTPNIQAEDKATVKFIFTKRFGEQFDIPLKAVLSGYGEVYVKTIKFYDYMGIFEKTFDTVDSQFGIKILPNIPDTGTQSEVLKSTSEKMSFDDSDEESDETAVGLTGVPGYEHRKYVSGDPLKRVNWKLSSKKDELMVRLDEKVSSSSQVFILDYPEVENPTGINYINADKIIEASLSMMSMLLRAGFESEYSFFVEDWETVEIKDEASLLYVQERLGGVKPYPAEHRFPEGNFNSKGKAQTCFTACTADMSGQLEALAENFNGSLVVTEMSGISRIQDDMWTVTDDFEFKKMQ
jgi:uncharacterized protein (DUF58 family)